MLKKEKKEKDVLRECLEYLRYKGYIAIRNNSGFIQVSNFNHRTRVIKMGVPGSPDIIACSPQGQFVAIECKSPSGRLTQIQKAFLDELRKNKAIVIVAKGVEDLIKNGI